MFLTFLVFAASLDTQELRQFKSVLEFNFDLIALQEVDTTIVKKFKDNLTKLKKSFKDLIKTKDDLAPFLRYKALLEKHKGKTKLNINDIVLILNTTKNTSFNMFPAIYFGGEAQLLEFVDESFKVQVDVPLKDQSTMPTYWTYDLEGTFSTPFTRLIISVEDRENYLNINQFYNDDSKGNWSAKASIKKEDFQDREPDDIRVKAEFADGTTSQEFLVSIDK